MSGLGLDDFIVTECGKRDTVVNVHSGVGTVPTDAHQKIETSPVQQVPSNTPTVKYSETFILVILPPMSATGRNSAIKGIQKFLQRPYPDNWRIALLDDAAESIPFSSDVSLLRSRVSALEHRVSPPQFDGGPWVARAFGAIDELAIQPGRHAIVFASDFGFDVFGVGANPWLLRVGPSAFTDAAIRAQAAMYTIQTSGPGTVVPLGGAAESQDLPNGTTGQMIAESMNMELVARASESSDFLYAADQTGGRYARDVQEAFDRVAADAAGYYQITFRPCIDEPDGAWHPVTVALRLPRARVRGPHNYLAPVEDAKETIPPSMLEALRLKEDVSGFDAAAHVWLFPDVAGANTSVMAADFSWSVKIPNFASKSKIRIFVELVDLIMHRAVCSWLSEREWDVEDDQSRTAHWQHEATLYPGAYSLRIVAMDMASGKAATRAYSFAVNLSPGPVTRVGQVLIAGRCLREEEREGRPNLFDPLMHDGCVLAPSASASVSIRDNPTVLVRIYPANEKHVDMIMKHWKAWVVVENGPRIPLTIARADVRGLTVYAKLDLTRLNLKPGTHPFKVVFEDSSDRGLHAKPLNSELTVKP